MSNSLGFLIYTFHVPGRARTSLSDEGVWLLHCETDRGCPADREQAPPMPGWTRRQMWVFRGTWSWPGAEEQSEKGGPACSPLYSASDHRRGNSSCVFLFPSPPFASNSSSTGGRWLIGSFRMKAYSASLTGGQDVMLYKMPGLPLVPL